MKRVLLGMVICLQAVCLSAGSTESNFKTLPLNDIKAGGWIEKQMLRDVSSGNISYLDHMRTLGPPVPDATRRRGFGEFEGNFMDGVVRKAFLTGNNFFLKKAKSMVDYLVEHQDASGYVGNLNPGNFETLVKSQGELWGQCCFLRPLLAYYEYSREQKYLETARRSVDYMIKLFGDESNRYFVDETNLEGGARAHGLMYIDVLQKLYQITGDYTYVEFAFRLYEDYSEGLNIKNKDSQLDQLLDARLPYLYHGPHVAEHARVIYWLSTMTDDPRYQRAAANSLVKFRQALSPSGGLTTDDNILESVGGKFGSPDLRYEYCSLLESAVSFESAFQLFGDPALAEEAENIVFNAGQAARLPDGSADAYCSKDNQIEAVGTPDNYTFRYQYAACHRIACCVFNAARLMPHYVANMWMKSSDGESLLAAFYGPSTVNTEMKGVKVGIGQETMYPFENEIVLTLDTENPVSFDLLLRNPSWSKNTKVIAEGAEIIHEQGFIRVSDRWDKGDKIRIIFSSPVEVRTSHNNELYIRRGALLYALKIDAVKKATKVWEGTDFANYDILPAVEGEVDRYHGYRLPIHTQIKVLTDTTLLIYKKNKIASNEFPFDESYGKIHCNFIYNGEKIEDELVPIGSTILRRTTFPEGR